MVIATRTLRLCGPGPARNVPIRLHAPEPDEGDRICRFVIDGPEGSRPGFATGVDAIQGLHLALPRIGSELYRSSHHAEGRLGWERAAGGYGFPVPPNARDLLAGEDRILA